MFIISVIATALPMTWVAYRQLQMLTADYRTVTSEQRLIRLHRGEIAIQTAPDNATHKRPFIVATPVGSIRALGTRFAVRTLDSDITQVEVYEHAVALKPAEGEIETRLEAEKSAV